jgi:hypothetical protein
MARFAAARPKAPLMPSKWKGKRIFPVKRREMFTERGLTVTLTIGGVWSELRAQLPVFGSQLIGFGYAGTLFVEAVELERTGEGQKGVLTITATERLTDGANLLAFPDPRLILEKEWLPVEVALRKHPNFNSTGNGGNALWLLSATDDAQLTAWENETDPALRATFHWSDATNTLSANAQEYAARILRNQTAFNVYLPAAKRTRFYGSSPVIGGCGKPEAPPAAFNMPTLSGNNQPYHYIKTADRCAKQGMVHEREENWIGFIDFDSDIINRT